MNQDKLNHIIRNPEQITAEDARELDELTRNFPYFTMPWVLLSRYYNEHNDYRYEETLHKTALRVSDRSWLYDFLYPKSNGQAVGSGTETAVEIQPDKEAEVTPAEITLQETEGEQNIVEIAEFVSENTESSFVPDLISPEPEKQELSEESESTTEFTETETTENIEGTMPVETIPEVDVPQTAPEEEAINAEDAVFTEEQADELLWNKHSSLIEIDSGMQEEENEVFEEIESFGIDSNSTVTEEEETPIPEIGFQSIISPDPDEDKPDSVESEEEEAQEDVKPASRLFSPAAVYNIEDYYPAGENNNEPPTDFFSWLSKPEYKEKAQAEKEAEAEIVVKKDEKKELIDRFIKNPAGVSKPKTEFFNAPEVAKKSDKFPQQIVTETLANVFMGQQNYQQAIKIYEALMLKIPEKSAYFAGLIKKIKEEHKL